MSVLTTRPQLYVPLAEAAVDLNTGAEAWANPDTWTPYFVTEAPTVIAGIVLLNSAADDSYARLQAEIAIGIGEPGFESEVGCFPFYGPNTGLGGPTLGPGPPPIGIFPEGTQISVRARSNGTEALKVALRYYEDYDGDYADINAVTLGMLPASADMIEITPNAAAWEPSAWVALSEALDVDTDVVALLMSTPVADRDLRWELGVGAVDAETVRTMFPSASRTVHNGRAWFAELPAPYPYLAGERVVMRMYSSGTETEPHEVALVVLRHTPAVPEEGDGVIGPLLWITMPFRPPVV